jgi:pyruvate kinase
MSTGPMTRRRLALPPELEQSLVLRPGDMLNVTRDCSPAPSDPDEAPWIGCTRPEVFDHARIREKIYFDDGRIGGEIIAAGHDLLQVRVDRAAS